MVCSLGLSYALYPTPNFNNTASPFGSRTPPRRASQQHTEVRGYLGSWLGNFFSYGVIGGTGVLSGFLGLGL